MNMIILANQVSARHWTGRLLNEVGLSSEQQASCQVLFVDSWEQAKLAAHAVGDRCSLVVWSDSLDRQQLAQVPDFPGQVVLVRQSHFDRFPQSNFSNCRVVDKWELDGEILREAVRIAELPLARP